MERKRRGRKKDKLEEWKKKKRLKTKKEVRGAETEQCNKEEKVPGKKKEDVERVEWKGGRRGKD